VTQKEETEDSEALGFNMNRKNIFFTSDWHLFHKNVIKLSERPFKDIEHMHKVLINNYNSCVPEEGIGYFLGDMGFHANGVLKKVISQLNGRKVIITGNHDIGVNALYNAGFDIVLNSASLIIAKQLVTLSHYPLLGVYREDITKMKNAILSDNWYGETKNKKNGVSDIGQFHLHGHIHSPNKGQSVKILGRQYDVGVDANKFFPVSISALESWISIYLNQSK